MQESYINELQGDLLASPAKVRCHQVNCQGVMGAGLAKQVKAKYPEAFDQYKALCDQFGSALLGHTQFIACHDGTIMANLFAQDGHGTGTVQTDLGALDDCLTQVAAFCFRVDAQPAFPKLLGCGLGGGDWRDVLELIQRHFDFKGAGCSIVEYAGEMVPEEAPAEEPKAVEAAADNASAEQVQPSADTEVQAQPSAEDEETSAADNAGEEPPVVEAAGKSQKTRPPREWVIAAEPEPKPKAKAKSRPRPKPPQNSGMGGLPRKKADNIPEVTIYTDGSCRDNPGPGGWAAVLIADTNKGPQEKKISGGKAMTTNNEMELMAVKEALSALKQPCKVALFSDSSYVVNSINEGWLFGWKKNGWVKKGGIANLELWKEVYQLLRKHEVYFAWVKGHADNSYNNICDQMAQAQSAKFSCK